MIDIVIPFKNHGTQARELDLTKKGFKKFLKNVRNVHVLEDEKPVDYTYKERDIFLKLIQAAKNPDISDTFLYAHDDHFILQLYDVEHFPLYHGGKTFFAQGDYRNTIQNTQKLLGTGIFNFDIHCPMLMTKAGVLSLEQYDWSKPWGYLIKTLYAYSTHDNVNGVFMPDFKFREHLLTTQMIIDIVKMKARPWVSASDRMFYETDELANALEQIYR